MVWHKVRTWNETAFVGNALPELTNAMGLHLIISDLDRPQFSDLDYALIDPQMVAGLRADWVNRAASCFPQEYYSAINNRVASAENFYLSLVAHLDQVRFSIRAPGWIAVLRAIAIACALATVIMLALIIRHPYGYVPNHAAIVAAEVFPLAAAAFGLVYAISRDRFRAKRARVVSDCVRQELRAAISHAFGRPISQLAREMELLKELSLD